MPRPPATPNRPLLAAIAVSVMVFLAMQFVRSVEPLGVDQGLFACFARWVPRGWLPYRDLFDSKPPLFLYTWALSALVPGDVVRAAWGLEAIWLAVTLRLIYALGRRRWDGWTGLAAASLLFAGLWAPGWGGFWSRAQAEELLALPLVGAAWAAWAAIDREPLAWWAGVLTGVAGLYKIPSMAVAAAWPVTWLLAGGWRPALRRTSRSLVGLALPWALAVGWFAAHGALGRFYEGVFVYARHNAEYIAPPWSQVLAGFARELIAQAPLELLLATVGLSVLLRRRAREGWWLLPLIVATMAAVILQRQLASYHYLLIMPGLALAGGFGLVELLRAAAHSGSKWRAPAALGLAAVLALAVRDVLRWTDAYAADALHLAGRLDRAAYLRRIQRGNYSLLSEALAADYLRQHTAATDGIFVWGLSPGIYALADRHPVTRYPFHKILFTDAPLSRLIPGADERRAELMRGLRADPPAYLLVGHDDQNGFDPEPSDRALLHFGELRAFVESGYHPELELGRFYAFRRGPR